MKLRSHLFLLAGAAVLPIVIFAAVVASRLIEHERDNFRRSAMERTRALMTAVDAELRGSITSIGVLATSRNLEQGDLGSVHEEALRALASQPGWISISVALPSGQQLLNTGAAFGQALPGIAEKASFDRVVATLRPSIGDVRTGLVTGRPGIPVRVPVLRSGAVAYVLTATVDVKAFGELLLAQRMPAGWTLAIADSSRRFVARIPHRAPGESVAPGFNAALLGAPEGWYRAVTVEGNDSYQSYSRSEFSGWGVGMAIPAKEYEATAWRTAGAMTAGAVASLLLAFALAAFIGRRIAGPMALLVSGAQAIARGEAVELDAPHRVAEISHVATALESAAKTVRKREETQRQAEAALRDADRRKDEFLATLSHELRNPLAPLRNALHLLRTEGAATPAANRVVALREMMERQVNHLVRLVDDLLEMSRISRGDFALRRERVAVATIVRNALETAEPLIREAAHELVTMVPEESLWLDGDPVRLAQVVANLLNNAAKYTPVGGQITVRVERHAETVAISVRDNGDGIAPGSMERLFEMFARGEQAGGRGPGGLGIGLALSRQLVKMHGGSLEGRSEGLGKGAEFTVRLPLATELGSLSGTAGVADTAMLPRRILVADDNRDAADSLGMILGHFGAQVHIARDGSEALASIASFDPDIAFLDIGMPGMDGYQVARAIRDRVPQLRVTLVALTGWGQESDRREAREAGFDHHLVKPVDIATLRALLRSLPDGQPRAG